MRMIANRVKPLATLATVVAGALALSACGGNDEATYEADVDDASGGEMIVVPDNAEGIVVDLPEAPMTSEAMDDEMMADDMMMEDDLSTD